MFEEMSAVKRLVVTLFWFGLTIVIGCHRSQPSTAIPVPVAAVVANSVTVTPGVALENQNVRSWKRPLLFRVTTSSKPFFLFGTIHLPDERFETFPAALEDAYRQSDALFTEIPMDDAVQAEIAPMLILPDGQSLLTLLPKTLYERVSSVFVAHGLPFEPFQRLKPWAISMQLAVIDQREALALHQPLDATLYERARADGKEVGGLESVREQLALFEGLDTSEQIEMLKQSLDYRDTTAAEGRDLVEELLSAYVAGNDQTILKLMREEYDPSDALSVKLMNRVLLERNRTLTERILSRVSAAPTKVSFFAVGSGHIVGNDGIVERLRQRGFRTVRVVP